MKTKLFKAFALLLMIPLMVTAAKGQSAYSNLVMSLNPVAYWPLQESAPAPRYDMETNYGSLGSLANGYYYSSAVIATNVGAIAGDPDGSRDFISGGNAGMLVPTTDNRVSLSAGQPFTVECWVRATEASAYCGIVNQTGPINSGGLNGAANDYGWSLVQDFATYRGTGSPNSGNYFGFHVFNGNGSLGGGEVEVTNEASGEWLSGGLTGYENSWVYLVNVFDGTNCWMYMFSTNLSAAYSGTNAMVYQIPVNSASGVGYFGTPTPVPGATFAPDTSGDPILFGETRSYSGNHNFGGFIDEVAIYTNALTFLQISNHFNAGTNGLANYRATILGDNPYMYWRMDAPKWTYQPPSSFPTAMNYGSAAYNMTNFNTGGQGPNCGVYQPGTVPGVAGPPYPGFGSFTNACAFNGLVGAVDAGYNTLLNPTGAFNNYTLVAWYKGNPMDGTLGSRTNSLASHSDRSWKAQFEKGTAYAYKGAQPQASIAPTAAFNPNDGNWHMYVLEVSSVNGGTGTNVSIYLDSGLYSATVANLSAITGTNALDVWIGGAPDPSYIEPTNEASFNSSEQYFAGRIAHVAFFTNALTFNQIQTLFFTAQPAPVISQQPVSGNAGLNGAFTNTVSVIGSGPFYYQWFTNNIPIAGATSTTLIVNPVLASSAGSYFVVITNIYGTVTSSVVNLTVVSNLTLNAQFPITYVTPMTLYGGTNISGTNYLGSSPTFSVSASGAAPISYQWLTNGTAVGGANGPNFTFTNCQLGSPTNFSCLITNNFGSLTSMVWSASYIPAPTAPFPQAVFAAQPIGYWRMNEGPDNGGGDIGTICNDYQSGNNGLYTNVVLADALYSVYPIGGYSPLTDPTETSTLFGYYNNVQDYVGGIQTNIDFSTPAGNNAEFSVAVWANGDKQTQAANAGLVSKGQYGAEQFTLDEGSSTTGCLRFVIRDALTGNYYAANSANNLGNDANWHYVVAVCDEANAQLLLYVDGQLVSTGALAAVGAGILNVGPQEILIGARDNGSGVVGGIQYNGFLNDAAIYNYALTSNQIMAQYNSAGIAAFFIKQPVTSINVDGGSTLVIPASVGGTPVLSMQWFDVNANSYIPGQTSNTLVIPNITANDTYYLTVSNTIEGVGYLTNSAQVSVTVYNQKPQVYVDVYNPFYALAGQTATNSATVFGALPLAYQWQFYGPTGWMNLSDNGRIIGSQTSALTINNVQGTDPGNYQLVITNIYGATTSSVATLIVQGVLPLGFGNGTGWTGTGDATFAGGVWTLTSGSSGNGAFFFQIPQYIGTFEASFTYLAQYDSTYPLADGITFCLQDDPRGVSATGSAGGDLGYTGITPSAALQFNIYPGNSFGGTGYAFGYDGSIGQTTPPGGVNLTNGAVDVSVLYANGQIALTLSNELSTAVFSTNIYVGSIPQELGSSTAYVGFTGSFGGDSSIQTVQNFQFVSIPPQAIQLTGNNAIITWPGSVVGNYIVQMNSNLTTTNWINVTNVAPALINGLNQATVPTGGSNQEFYRLILSQP